jgi:hypothetical protein
MNVRVYIDTPLPTNIRAILELPLIKNADAIGQHADPCEIEPIKHKINYFTGRRH